MDIKKMILSGGMLVFVAAVVVGGTGAFFSDTETSTGNVFTAGSVSIGFTGIEHTYGYNDGDDPVDNYFDTSTQDTIPFFIFNDMKPRDAGELSFGLKNGANDAHVCAYIGGEEPTANPDLALWENLNFFDTEGNQILPGTWFDLGDWDANEESDYFVDYCFGDWDGSSCNVDPNTDYNLAQNGSFGAELTLFAIQTRNNEDFSCDDLTLNNDGEPVYTPPTVLGTTVQSEGRLSDGEDDNYDFTQTFTPTGTNDEFFGWNPVEIERSVTSQGDYVVNVTAPRDLDTNPDNFDLVFDTNNNGTVDFLVYYHTDPNEKVPNGSHWGYKDYNSGFNSESSLPAGITVSPEAQAGDFTVTIDSSLISGSDVAVAMQMILADEGSPVPAGTGESMNIIVPATVSNIFGGSSADFIVDSL